MTVHRAPDCDDIYFVDVPMLGTQKVNSPYVIDAPEPTLVDTGPADGVDTLLTALDELGIEPAAVSYIIPTHAHLDHAGGAGHLTEVCEDATVICHETAAEYLTDEEKLDQLEESVERAIGMARPYGEPTVIDRDRCRTVSGGETLGLGDRTLDVIDAPGHAPHQLCLYDRHADVLFSADAAGMHFGDDHRPTTPPPDFDLQTTLETVDRLLRFEPETVLYAHFGPGVAGEGVPELYDYAELLPAFVDEVATVRQEVGDDVGAIALSVADRWNHWALTTDVAGVLRYLDGQS